MLDYIPNALAYRDLIEKHGLLEDFVIIQSPELYGELCDFENDYKMELILNGIENFRLEKKENK